MLVTLILIAALLAGGTVLIHVQMASSLAADVSRSSTLSLHCAEAGLVTARPIVASNFNQWDSALASYPSTDEPAWLAAGIGNHDLDGDGVGDFVVYIQDNDDEVGAPNDRTRNSDMMVFIVSRCTRYPETPREVRELVEFSAGAVAYEAQAGGGTAANNRTQ